MQNVAVEGQTKYGNDPVLKFFYAYSLICEGKWWKIGLKDVIWIWIAFYSFTWECAYRIRQFIDNCNEITHF